MASVSLYDRQKWKSYSEILAAGRVGIPVQVGWGSQFTGFATLLFTLFVEGRFVLKLELLPDPLFPGTCSMFTL